MANQKKRIIIGFGLFLSHFEQIANSNSELAVIYVLLALLFFHVGNTILTFFLPFISHTK